MFKRFLLGFCLLAAATSCMRQPCVPIECQREANALRDLSILLEDSELPCEKLTLADVIEIALRKNLDLQVKAFEYAVQYEASTGECLKMLPNLIANGEWYYRNRNTGSFSESLLAGVPPAPPSISSEQHQARTDLSISWNLLDFGLAYFRSRQERNKAYVLQLEYERLRQNLIVDVTRQYWKAIAARKAMEEHHRLGGKISTQIEIYKRLENTSLLPKITTLRGQNQLLNMHIELEVYDREYHTAMATLVSQMGLPPCTIFELIEEESVQFPPRINPSCYLEDLALLNRPELYIGDLQERIMTDEIRVALLQMLPGVEFYDSNYYDSNRFLIYNYWNQIGLRATWNLLALPRHISESKTAALRTELAKENRLAVSLGVLTQLHLALITYADSYMTYLLYADLRDVNRKMLAAARDETRHGKMHQADLIKYETESAISEIDALKAYGELQVAVEQINSALGVPFFFNRYGANIPLPEYVDTIEAEQNDQAKGPLLNNYQLPKLEGLIKQAKNPPPPSFHPNQENLDRQTKSGFQNESWMWQSAGEGSGGLFEADPKGFDTTKYWMEQPGYQQRLNRDQALPIRTPSGTTDHVDVEFDRMMTPGYEKTGT